MKFILRNIGMNGWAELQTPPSANSEFVNSKLGINAGRSLQLRPPVHAILFIALLVLATSCSFIPPVGENYEKPKTEMPQKWASLKNQDQSHFVAIETKWWRNFDDPILDLLIEIALKNNYDFQIAQSRVLEARANISEKTSNMLPKVNARANGTRMNNFFNPVNPNRRPIINFFTAGFDASWEIDLFGGNYRARQAAKALFEASDEEKNYIAISLIAEVVKNYANLRNAQNQLFLQKQINQSYQEITQLNEEKKLVGLISEIDFGRIKIEMLNNLENLASAEADNEISLYNLELLLAKKPGEMKNFLGDFGEIPIIRKDIIISAPLDLLRNRPDIKQAERQLESSVAMKGYALAQVFPKISLTSFLGFINTKSGSLFNSPSRSFSLGGGVTTPILNFGGLSAGLKISDQRKKQALLNYEAKVNQALADVEISMVNFVKEDEKLLLNLQSFEIYEMIVKLDKERSDKGIISYVEFLRSKIDFLQSKQKLNQTKFAFSEKTVALYKALGGGWSEEIKNK
jgi:NodT family efflux transporter outer membrane factor (OMF) lipoprotein